MGVSTTTFLPTHTTATSFKAAVFKAVKTSLVPSDCAKYCCITSLGKTSKLPTFKPAGKFSVLDKSGE